MYVHNFRKTYVKRKLFIPNRVQSIFVEGFRFFFGTITWYANNFDFDECRCSTKDIVECAMISAIETRQWLQLAIVDQILSRNQFQIEWYVFAVFFFLVRIELAVFRM